MKSTSQSIKPLSSFLPPATYISNPADEDIKEGDDYFIPLSFDDDNEASVSSTCCITESSSTSSIEYTEDEKGIVIPSSLQCCSQLQPPLSPLDMSNTDEHNNNIVLCRNIDNDATTNKTHHIANSTNSVPNPMADGHFLFFLGTNIFETLDLDRNHGQSKSISTASLRLQDCKHSSFITSSPPRMVMLQNDIGLKQKQYPSHIPPKKSCLSPSPSKSSLKSMTRTNSSLEQTRRSVSFTNLQIREYDVALSDNPSCSYGPPIELGWNYNIKKDSIDLDEYERKRIPQRRKNKSNLALNYYEREVLLRRVGTKKYSEEEINDTIKIVKRIQLERKVTTYLLPVQIIDEAIENVTSFMKQHMIFRKN